MQDIESKNESVHAKGIVSGDVRVDEHYGDPPRETRGVEVLILRRPRRSTEVVTTPAKAVYTKKLAIHLDKHGEQRGECIRK